VRKRGVRGLLYAAVGLLYLLHDDFWFRNDPRFVLGLPVGLAYHVGYCLVAAILMAFLVRAAWPRGVESDDEARGR
jgi:hypothetical protein